LSQETLKAAENIVNEQVHVILAVSAKLVVAGDESTKNAELSSIAKFALCDLFLCFVALPAFCVFTRYFTACCSTPKWVKERTEADKVVCCFMLQPISFR